MGWSWALYYCHSMLSDLQSCGIGEGGGDLAVIREKFACPAVGPTAPLAAPYVDNANLLGLDEGAVNRCLERVKAALTPRG
eukprot:1648087-Lingulodinium_polyedra.AAC.1